MVAKYIGNNSRGWLVKGKSYNVRMSCGAGEIMAVTLIDDRDCPQFIYEGFRELMENWVPEQSDWMESAKHGYEE